MNLTQRAICTAATLALSSSGWASGNLFHGSITWADPKFPLHATEQWASSTTTFVWSVSYDATSKFPWQYDYSWITSDKDLSHLILEVSPTAVASNFLLETKSDGPLWYKPTDPGKSNPELPESIFGMKFEGDAVKNHEGLKERSISFQSTLAPTWGDFYAKSGVNTRKVNGKAQQFNVLAYNSGFMETDPLVDLKQIQNGDRTTLWHNGPRANHIVIPGTANLLLPKFAPIPEATAGWGFAGLAGAAMYGARRKRLAAQKTA